MKHISLDYFRTARLNFLFVLLIPLLLAFFIIDSMSAFMLYLFMFSIIEHYFDARYYYKTFSAGKFAVTVCFNFLIIQGLSLLIEYLLFNAGLLIVIALTVAWVLLVSWLEIMMDRKLNERVW